MTSVEYEGPSRRCAVIYNPTKVSEKFRALIEDSLQREGWVDTLWLETSVEDPGRAMTRQAVAEQVDLVIGAGGDGTIRYVADVLAHTGIPLGLVPAGTGNLLARNLDLPLEEADAIEVALSGQARQIDLVKITVDDRAPEHFAVMAGIGVDAMIMDETDEDLKDKVGSAAYFIAAAKALGRLPVRMTVQLDTSRPVRRHAMLCVIGNVGTLRGNLTLIPGASPDDGLLDLYIASPRRFRQWVKLALRLITRRAKKDDRVDQRTGKECGSSSTERRTTNSTAMSSENPPPSRPKSNQAPWRSASRPRAASRNCERRYLGKVTSPTQQLAPALDIDARLTEIERSVDLLLNVTPVNAAEAWADFERSDFGTVPTLRLRPLEFEPDLVRRDLYKLEIEDVSDPALHTLFRAKRDEIARQITTLEDRDTSRFVYGSLQLYGGIAQPLASAAEELLETIPARAPSTRSVTAGAFAEAAHAEFDRYRAVYPDFPAQIEVRDDISDLMVSFGRLLIPEAAAFRADRVQPLCITRSAPTSSPTRTAPGNH